MNQFWSNLVTMTSDLARRCPMTFDPVKGHSRSQGSNFIFFFKMYLLLQTTCDINMSWSYDSTSVLVYGVYTDLRSKVIKGSFPVRIQKSSKCIFFYKQHVILTWVGHMTRHQSVSMGCTQIWGQRSLRGHFRSESKNLLKMYLLLQTTCDIDRSWSYDSTSVGVYRVLSDLRSKVIKGSFQVRNQKSLKIHIC